MTIGVRKSVIMIGSALPGAKLPYSAISLLRHEKHVAASATGTPA
jgi:hypothetical protein